jgi:hypothetical protein
MRKSYYLILFSLFAGLSNNYAQTILNQDGKYGLADKDGKVVLKPIYDMVSGNEYLTTFFIVKQGGKYAYAYKVELDSLTNLNKEDCYWNISGFEFDSLHISMIGTSSYKLELAYTEIKYKKNGLWGMIYLQSIVDSDVGAFVAVNVAGLGKLRMREAKYDEILDENKYCFWTTRLKNKYGLLNAVKNVECTPQFDASPVLGKEEHLYNVKLKDKCGLIKFNDSTKAVEYIVPCRYEKIKDITNDTYVPIGRNDTMTIYSTIYKTPFTPLINGKPIVNNNDSQQVRLHMYLRRDNPYYYITVTKTNDKPSYSGDYNAIYLVDISQGKIIASYDEVGKYYRVLPSSKNGLISKVSSRPDESKSLYEFYNIETGELKFSLKLDADGYSAERYKDPYYSDEQQKDFLWEVFEPLSGNTHKVLGYYDFTNEKFTHLKPSFTPSGK